MQDVWTRDKKYDSIFAKKINSNAVGAADVFTFGDNTLRIYIYCAPTEDDIEYANIYRILTPAITQEFTPIMSGATKRTGFTPNKINVFDYGTWLGTILAYSK